MERWLVTGASGFLGANAPLSLLGKAHLTALVRPGTPLPPGYDAVVEADLRQPSQFLEAVESVVPDVVLHAAALSGHEACENDPHLASLVNSRATGVIADAARRLGSTFVYISTDAVFDGYRGHYSEDDAAHPFSVYGQTKLDGERAALGVYPDTLVLRTNFFGWSPSGSGSILEFFVHALRSGTPVNGYADFTVSSLYVREVLDVIWRLVSKRVTGVMHVASSDALSKYDFARQIAEIFELDGSLVRPVSAAQQRHAAARNRDISLDVNRLTATLGQPPSTQRQSIMSAKEDEWVVVERIGASRPR